MDNWAGAYNITFIDRHCSATTPRTVPQTHWCERCYHSFERTVDATIMSEDVLYTNVASMNLLDQATSHRRWSHLGAA